MPVPRGPWGWHPHGARLRHPGYAPLTTLLYRSVSYSPWLASIIVRRILSCSIRFLSTSRLARRKRMMPEGKPMALQDSQAGDEESQRGYEGPGVAQTPHCSALQAPETPHPTPEEAPGASPAPPSQYVPPALTRPPPPASSGSWLCAWGCTPPLRGAPHFWAPGWPVAPLAGGSSAPGAVCPGGLAAPRAWWGPLPAALRGERR